MMSSIRDDLRKQEIEEAKKQLRKERQYSEDLRNSLQRALDKNKELESKLGRVKKFYDEYQDQMGLMPSPSTGCSSTSQLSSDEGTSTTSSFGRVASPTKKLASHPSNDDGFLPKGVQAHTQSQPHTSKRNLCKSRQQQTPMGRHPQSSPSTEEPPELSSDEGASIISIFVRRVESPTKKRASYPSNDDGFLPKGVQAHTQSQPHTSKSNICKSRQQTSMRRRPQSSPSTEEPPELFSDEGTSTTSSFGRGASPTKKLASHPSNNGFLPKGVQAHTQSQPHTSKRNMCKSRQQTPMGRRPQSSPSTEEPPELSTDEGTSTSSISGRRVTTRMQKLVSHPRYDDFLPKGGPYIPALPISKIQQIQGPFRSARDSIRAAHRYYDPSSEGGKPFDEVVQTPRDPLLSKRGAIKCYKQRNTTPRNTS